MVGGVCLRVMLVVVYSWFGFFEIGVLMVMVVVVMEVVVRMVVIVVVVVMVISMVIGVVVMMMVVFYGVGRERGWSRREALLQWMNHGKMQYPELLMGWLTKY